MARARDDLDGGPLAAIGGLRTAPNHWKAATMNHRSTSMAAILYGVALAFYAPAQALAQSAERSREGAGVVVEGVVREVFRTTRAEGLAYLVQVDVGRSELGRGYRGTAHLAGPAPGDPLYIHVDSPGLDGSRLSGSGETRMPLPEQQSSIRAYINPRSQGGWQNACSDWYEPIARGGVAQNSASSGPAPGRETQPAPSQESALEILGVAAQQVKASGRLVFKVDDVRPDSPAGNAGIEKGDAIIGVNGAPIASLEEFADTLRRAGPSVKLVVLNTRTGQPAVVPVDLKPVTASRRGDAAPGREPAPVARRRIGIRGESVRLGLGSRTGLKITEVEPDSPGQKAGLEVGDVIVSANGASVSDIEAIEAAARSGGPVLKVNVRDSRSGREVQVEITLGEERPPAASPAGSSRSSSSPSPGGGLLSSLGVTIESATADSLPVVKVSRVSPGSPADNAGIKPGDVISAVNRAAIFAPDLLEEEIKKAGQSFTLSVLDSRTGKKNELKINLDR
jgi:S1-C subfamily serine protease